MSQTQEEKTRHFECSNCHMTVTFPFWHSMTNKMVGTYWVQDQWFCCLDCLEVVYDPQQSSERR